MWQRPWKRKIANSPMHWENAILFHWKLKNLGFYPWFSKRPLLDCTYTIYGFAIAFVLAFRLIVFLCRQFRFSVLLRPKPPIARCSSVQYRNGQHKNIFRHQVSQVRGCSDVHWCTLHMVNTIISGSYIFGYLVERTHQNVWLWHF